MTYRYGQLTKDPVDRDVLVSFLQSQPPIYRSGRHDTAASVMMNHHGPCSTSTFSMSYSSDAAVHPIRNLRRMPAANPREILQMKDDR